MPSGNPSQGRGDAGPVRVVPISFGFVSVFLLLSERPVLVDTGMPGSEARILQALARAGFAPRDLALILLTHAHADHTGSLAALRAATGAPVAIHEGDAPALRTGQSAVLTPNGRFGRIATSLTRRLPLKQQPPTEPDVVIGGELSLEPYGLPGRVLSTPGHTPGSVSIVLADRQVLAGDLIMGGMLLGRRTPGYPFAVDDLAQTRASIERLLALAPQRIWASHGGPFEPAAVRSWLN
jgi:hydroxyacylglutathione hydrolase